MSEFEFAFVVENFDFDDDLMDRLYAASEGVSVAETFGRTTVEFLLDAATLHDAMTEGLAALDGLGHPVRVLRVDRDLVAIPEIARRAELTAEAVRLLVQGKRGPGGFPSPDAVLAGGSRVWEWGPVLGWLKTYGRCVDEPIAVDHETAAHFDAELVSRSSTPRATDAPGGSPPAREPKRRSALPRSVPSGTVRRATVPSDRSSKAASTGKPVRAGMPPRPNAKSPAAKAPAAAKPSAKKSARKPAAPS